MLTMLNDAPISGALIPWFKPFGSWILNVPSLAGSRGIIIATAIGIVGFTIRAMLGYEKAALGVSD
jgi:hypothetical protein